MKVAARSSQIGLILMGDGGNREKLARRVADSSHLQLLRPIYDFRLFATLMAGADAFNHGSEVESFGRVALEAVASGLPLIVPNEGGTAEIAEPQFAERYRARNIPSCAAAIRRLLDRDPATLKAALQVAAPSVRTNREHAVALVIYYYEGLSVA